MKPLVDKLRTVVEGLFPGYFAMVMATGVLAIQANNFGYAVPARILVAIGVITYVTLVVLTLLRASLYPGNLVADFRSFVKGPAFFTVSAGTTVLGKSLLLVLHQVALAEALWAVDWFIWAFLIYAFAMNLFISKDKPVLDRSVNGVWLIMPVATQSLSILTSLLSPSLPNHELMMLVALSMYMLGCAMYLVVIAAVLYRLVFFQVDPADLRPAYWVCMGASAISTLAGVELCKRVDMWPLPFQPLPSLQGFTMFFWVLATAWIPLLIGLGIWRHGFSRVPLNYDPQFWSMVFPLAMYAICTAGVSTIFGLAPLKTVSQVFLFIAGATWLTVFIGLLKNIVEGAFQSLRVGTPGVPAGPFGAQRRV